MWCDSREDTVLHLYGSHCAVIPDRYSECHSRIFNERYILIHIFSRSSAMVSALRNMQYFGTIGEQLRLSSFRGVLSDLCGSAIKCSQFAI